MICPMMSRPIVDKDECRFEAVNCKEGWCAWWDDSEKQCAVRVLLEHLVEAIQER